MATKIFTGFICKNCGGPAPRGVGYFDHEARGTDNIVACECGYRVDPRYLDAERKR